MRLLTSNMRFAYFVIYTEVFLRSSILDTLVWPAEGNKHDKPQNLGAAHGERWPIYRSDDFIIVATGYMVRVVRCISPVGRICLLEAMRSYLRQLPGANSKNIY